MKLIITLLTLMLSLNSFASYVYGIDNFWTVYQKSGVQFIEWNEPNRDIDLEFYNNIEKHPKLKLDLPTVVIINSFGGKVNPEPVLELMAYGTMNKLLAQIEKKSKTPIHILVSENCMSFCGVIYASFENRLALSDVKFGFHGASDSLTSRPVVKTDTTNSMLNYFKFREIREDWLNEHHSYFTKLQMTIVSPNELIKEESNFINRGEFKNINEVIKYMKSRDVRNATFQFYKNDEERKYGRLIKQSKYCQNMFSTDACNDSKLEGSALIVIGKPVTLATKNEKGKIENKAYYFTRFLDETEFDYGTEFARIYKKYDSLPEGRSYRGPFFVPAENICLERECETNEVLQDNLEKLMDKVTKYEEAQKVKEKDKMRIDGEKNVVTIGRLIKRTTFCENVYGNLGCNSEATEGMAIKITGKRVQLLVEDNKGNKVRKEFYLGRLLDISEFDYEESIGKIFEKYTYVRTDLNSDDYRGPFYFPVENVCLGSQCDSNSTLEASLAGILTMAKEKGLL